MSTYVRVVCVCVCVSVGVCGCVCVCVCVWVCGCVGVCGYFAMLVAKVSTSQQQEEYPTLSVSTFQVFNLIWFISTNFSTQKLNKHLFIWSYNCARLNPRWCLTKYRFLPDYLYNQSNYINLKVVSVITAWYFLYLIFLKCDVSRSAKYENYTEKSWIYVLKRHWITQGQYLGRIR